MKAIRNITQEIREANIYGKNYRGGINLKRLIKRLEDNGTDPETVAWLRGEEIENVEPEVLRDSAEMAIEGL